MKKILKKIKYVAKGCVVPLIFAPTLSLISCSQEDIVVESIELYSESDTIRPGENNLIRAVATPDFIRITNLNWQLIDCPYKEINISDKGLLSVNSSIDVDEPIEINISASLLNDSSISSTIVVTLLPKPNYNFQGFKDNKIEYIGRDETTWSSEIIKTGEFTYETKENVNVFERAQIIPGWSSLINFVPLAVDEPNFMSFTIEGSEFSTHAIQWTQDYDDSSWTRTIPNFDVYGSTACYDDVTVRFSCDPRVSFVIHFSAWQSPDDVSPPIFSYISEDVEDTKDIEYNEEGIYILNILCPAYDKSGVISESYNSIYCYRPKYQYTELTFEYEVEEFLDQDEIFGMFTEYHMTEPVLTERKFDHIRAYKFDFSYKMDLSQKTHTYEHWDYSNIHLGSIKVYDPMFNEDARCEIWLKWVV